MDAVMLAVAPKEMVKTIYKEQTYLIFDSYPKYRSVPFTAYFYCTKERPELSLQPVGCRPPSPVYCINYEHVYAPYTFLGGKVVVKCIIDRIDVIEMCQIHADGEAAMTHALGYKLQGNYSDLAHLDTPEELVKAAGLTSDEFIARWKDKMQPLYAYHITQLEVFNPAKKLNEFKSYQTLGRHKTGATIKDWLPMKKMSKSWVYIQDSN